MANRKGNKMDFKSDEEAYVRLTRVQEMLQIQKEHFTELLQQQQNNCKDFIKLILDKSNKQLDDLTRKKQDLKMSLRYTQNEVDALKTDNIKLSAELKTLQTEQIKASEDLSYTNGVFRGPI